MLALISGRGGLPARVAEKQIKPPLVCVLEGFEPDNLDADITFRLEHLGSLMQTLKQRGVTDICLCGAISRPAFDPAALDKETMPLVPVIAAAMGAGDDAALRAVMTLFEGQGFKVRAAHELAPEILVREGVLSATAPDKRITADADRGWDVLHSLSDMDVGQGCVVGAGQVWGIETVGGTQHLLETLPDGAERARAVFVKAPKQGQDHRADMPTIGPDTIRQVAAAGLAGIVLQAGQVIMLDPDTCVELADNAGLVLWSRKVG